VVRLLVTQLREANELPLEIVDAAGWCGRHAKAPSGVTAPR
jgi:hypothetical protein